MDGGFREALLRQDGIEPGVLPDSEWRKIERLRARERRNVRWWKLGTLAAWLLTIAVYVASALQGHLGRHQGAYPVSPRDAHLGKHAVSAQPDQTAWQKRSKWLVLRIIMPIEAAIMSLWLYIRTRSVGRRRLRAALLTCERELQALANTGKRGRGPFR